MNVVARDARTSRLLTHPGVGPLTFAAGCATAASAVESVPIVNPQRNVRRSIIQ
jgi:hypothetical protein